MVTLTLTVVLVVVVAGVTMVYLCLQVYLMLSSGPPTVFPGPPLMQAVKNGSIPMQWLNRLYAMITA